MLEGIETRLNVNYLKEKDSLSHLAKVIIYTGTIDEYFDYALGELQYRSLRFEEHKMNIKDFQHCAVINYTSADIPFTRSIEHKHFMFKNQDNTIVTYEYPQSWQKGVEPYYPINNERNINLYNEYIKLAKNENNVIFGGRLGCYKYFDMDKVIESAMDLSKEIIFKY